MDFQVVSIDMHDLFHTNDEKKHIIDTRATETFAMRITPEDKTKVWLISEHFNVSMSRVVQEGLALLFPVADKKMREKRIPKTFL